MIASNALPFLAALTGAFMVFTAFLVVRGNDLVYSSSSLAVLGMLNALMIALLGYYLVASFLVVVYVGAAVMFIIITVSMIGGKEPEGREESKGFFTAGILGSAMFLLLTSIAAYLGFQRPGTIPASQVAVSILSGHEAVVGVILVALAATLIEAIAIARRG